jgi:hypothetical protein
MDHLIVGDCFLRMIESGPFKGVKDVLVIDLFGIVVDQETACGRIEISSSDTMSHIHESLLYIIMDCAVLE